MQLERVLRNTAATITVTFYNGSTAVDADVDPSIVIKKADGTTLLSTTATNEPGTGVYSVVIPPQATLNYLTLTWTGTFTGTQVQIVSNVEIVGGFIFSIAELRNYDNSLTNTVKYPTSALVDARTAVEAEFEDICGRSFVPRFNREEYIMGQGYLEYSTAYDGTVAYSTIPTEKYEPFRMTKLLLDGSDRVADVNANLVRKSNEPAKFVYYFGSGAYLANYAQNITMEYEYGMQKVPVPIKEKALKRAKMKLMGQNSTIDERALTMSLPDIGTINLATPGVRGSETGVPDIDVVLSRYTLSGGAEGVVIM